MLQVGHGAQLGLYLPEVGDGVAAVAAALGALQQGHQMEIVDPALLQIGQLLSHPIEGAGKGVGVEHHAQQLPAAVPVGVGFPLGVLHPQVRLAVLPAPAEHLGEVVKGAQIAVVQLAVEPLQFIVVTGQTVLKDGGIFSDPHLGGGQGRCRLSFLFGFGHLGGGCLRRLLDQPVGLSGSGRGGFLGLLTLHGRCLLPPAPPWWAWREWLRCGSRSWRPPGWQRQGWLPVPGQSGPPEAFRPGSPDG